MAAPKGNKNATGNSGGKTLQDRELAAAVRNLALGEIKAILEQKKMSQLKQQVILRLASSVLPRLNEHSGEGGGAIQLTWKSKLTTNQGSGLSPSTPRISAG
jgi:hypothetical protein